MECSNGCTQWAVYVKAEGSDSAEEWMFMFCPFCGCEVISK